MRSIVKTMFVVALFSAAIPALSAETSVLGLWQTASKEKGYLHVSIEKCGDAYCGIISKAMNHEGESNPDYEHLGKKMLWDMMSRDSVSWSGGRIWDPTEDKSYKSKMSLNNDVLEVSGCIAFFCRSESWTRVTQ
ncbi:MAG: DUF2147 domain-containing protein [Granulosicoccus sp.]